MQILKGSLKLLNCFYYQEHFSFKRTRQDKVSDAIYYCIPGGAWCLAA